MKPPPPTPEDLSRSEHESCSAKGYFGPVRIFDLERCRDIAAHFESGTGPAPAGWWKGHAVSDRFVYDIATGRDILDRVTTVLGPNIVLWGAQYIRKDPGEEHQWHADIETLDFPDSFVSVWVGLANTSERSGLTFVAGSHRLGISIQQVAAERGISRVGLPDAEVLSLAREVSGHTFIERPTVSDGDALFFAGGIWHASLNTTKYPRSALLLQFVTPDVPVRILDFRHLDWPFAFTDTPAPSLLVAGTAGDSPHDLRSIPEPGI